MIFSKLFLTISKEGFKAVLIKIFRRLHYYLLRNLSYNQEDKKSWEKLKAKYKGKRVFLIGNGPSLNKLPLYLLKNEYTMAFNRFYIMEERLNWIPNFFTTVDNLVLEDLCNDVEKITSKVDYAFFPKIHFRGTNFSKKIPNKPNILWLRQKFGKNFSKVLPDVYQGGSVIIEGLQILNYLGFDKIYLIGVDMNFQLHTTTKSLNNYSAEIISLNDDDPNHFDPRYFGKNRKYHQPEDYIIKNIMNSLNYIGGNLDRFGLNIINAGVDSKVEAFPKENFIEILNISPEEQKRLFTDLLKKTLILNDVKESIDDIMEVSDAEIVLDDLKTFIAPMSIAISIIQKLIFTHIPLGPYDNKFYFIKRKTL
ncbi:MAG TPA: DUF115 domain-containing protein [Bacteroidales bacterium]|nr:DUF115 domain-containing protein [Bacteroidales bacterium]